MFCYLSTLVDIVIWDSVNLQCLYKTQSFFISLNQYIIHKYTDSTQIIISILYKSGVKLKYHRAYEIIVSNYPMITVFHKQYPFISNRFNSRAISRLHNIEDPNVSS